MIEITTEAIDPAALREQLFDPAAGAYCGFEGWIRNENEGKAVLRLEYEAYEPLALSEPVADPAPTRPRPSARRRRFGER